MDDFEKIEEGIDYFFGEARENDIKKDLEVISLRSKLTCTFPKKGVLTFKPFGRPFLINVMFVKRKRYIIPDDLAEDVKGTSVEKFQRRRWVTNAVIVKKTKQGNIRTFIGIIELLPSIAKEMIRLNNIGKKKDHKVSSFDKLNFIFRFMDVGRKTGKDHRNLSYNVSVSELSSEDQAIINQDFPTAVLRLKKYSREDLQALYKTSLEEEEFYEMIRGNANERNYGEKALAN